MACQRETWEMIWHSDVHRQYDRFKVGNEYEWELNSRVMISLHKGMRFSITSRGQGQGNLDTSMSVKVFARSDA